MQTEAGPELDALIAEKVMGFVVAATLFESVGGYAGPYKGLRIGDDYSAWSPSTDIAAAWVVIERLQADGYHVVLFFDDIVKRQWTARFPNRLSGRDQSSHGDTAPLAICRAALAAVTPDPPAVEPRKPGRTRKPAHARPMTIDDAVN